MCEEREVQQHNPVWSLLFRSFILCIAPFLKGDRKRDGDDDEASWRTVTVRRGIRVAWVTSLFSSLASLDRFWLL